MNEEMSDDFLHGLSLICRRDHKIKLNRKIKLKRTYKRKLKSIMKTALQKSEDEKKKNFFSNKLGLKFKPGGLGGWFKFNPGDLDG